MTHHASPRFWQAYDALPESEKEYDRTTAMETVKTILALGYRIEKT